MLLGNHGYAGRGAPYGPGGDVITNRFFPILPDADSNGQHWVSILDQLAALRPRTIVPGHGEVDTIEIIARQRGILQALQFRTRKLKSEGVSAEDAARILIEEFRAKYLEYENTGMLAMASRGFTRKHRSQCYRLTFFAIRAKFGDGSP
jgi:glyoxylase-like metal-dependent hydrolase (beta-lactamase superfamily II)